MRMIELVLMLCEESIAQKTRSESLLGAELAQKSTSSTVWKFMLSITAKQG